MSAPTLDQVFRDVQRLPLEDQRALATLLDPPKSLEEIAAEQGIGPFDFQAALQDAAGLWPEEESADDFVAAVREWRSEGAQRELN